MPETQLYMTRPNLDGLPEITIPEGYGIRTYQPGDEAAWADIMNTGIGSGWTAERCMEDLTHHERFRPDGLLFITYEDRLIGTACAFPEPESRPNRAQVHMVCVMPEHRGKGLGLIITLAVMHFMRDHGYTETFLGTDDFRIPAIKAYLNLGFQPDYIDESHRLRWAEIFSQIGQTEQWWRHARPEPQAYQIREAQGNRALLVILDSGQREAYNRVCRTILSGLYHLDIPYRVFDLSADREPGHAFTSHNAIIFAQEGLGDSLSEAIGRQIIKAIKNNVGLINFDHLVDRYPPSLSDILPFDATYSSLTTESVKVPVSDHFIVGTHEPDKVHTFLQAIDVLSTKASDDSQTLMETNSQIPGLVVCDLEPGRIVQFLLSPAVWEADAFGHCEGLDDIFWKAIVWAARKPFVMKAMPSLVTFRVQDATGTGDHFDWTGPLLAHDWQPYVSVLCEEVPVESWRVMADLAQSGQIEWFPQALADMKPIYFNRSANNGINEEEVQMGMAQAKGLFDQYNIPIAKSMNAHRNEYSRYAIPLLKEWGVRYILNTFIPNESLNGDHLNWEPEPYGHSGYIFDHLAGYTDMLVTATAGISHSSCHYIDADKTRYTIDFDGISARNLVFPDTSTEPENDIEQQAQVAFQSICHSLDNRFYGVVNLSEKMIKAFTSDQWELFLNRLDALLASTSIQRVSQDFIGRYAESKVHTHFAGADYDYESDTLHVILKGNASEPLQIQLFDEACRERSVTCDAFENQLEKSIRISE